MRLLIGFAFNILVVLLAARVLDFVRIDGFWTAALVVLVLGILNVFLKPILTILTIPVTLFTLGLFLLVINAVIILVTDYLVNGFDVYNFWGAFLFGLILTLSNSLLDMVLDPKS